MIDVVSCLPPSILTNWLWKLHCTIVLLQEAARTQQEIVNERAEFSRKLAEIKEQTAIMKKELKQKQQDAASAEMISKELSEHVKDINLRIDEERKKWEERIHATQSLTETAQEEMKTMRRQMQVVEDQFKDCNDKLEKSQLQVDELQALSSRLQRKLDSEGLTRQQLEETVARGELEMKELKDANAAELDRKMDVVANILASLQREESAKNALQHNLAESEQRCQRLQVCYALLIEQATRCYLNVLLSIDCSCESCKVAVTRWIRNASLCVVTIGEFGESSLRNEELVADDSCMCSIGIKYPRDRWGY